jgi:serine/threonine protein kinase
MLGFNMQNKIGKLIGSGGTADVYEWGEKHVIKLYKPHITHSVIENEEFIGKILNHTKLAIPKCIETVKLDDNYGLIYEFVPGKSLAEILVEDMEVEVSANHFAKLHYEIHQKTIDTLPSQYKML